MPVAVRRPARSTAGGELMDGLRLKLGVLVLRIAPSPRLMNRLSHGQLGRVQLA